MRCLFGPKELTIPFLMIQTYGYKATPFVGEDLAKGIEWVLSDENRHKELCLKTRKKAVTCFDIEKVAGQYAELYGEVIG
jgi:glycosyltransferase involved in cell wall biosynthesis